MRRLQPQPLLVTLLLLCPGLALADSRVEARRHFKTGMFLISQGQSDEGIAELLEAYAIKPHPNVLYNVARAHEAAGRPVEALSFYRRYLETRPPDAAKVEEAIARLEPLVPKKEEPKPPEEKKGSAVAAPAVDEATLARLAALTERLEKAVEKAEAAPKPAPAEEPLPPVDGASPTPAPAAEDLAMPYEETVVAASRRAQSTLEAPNATTIITGDELRLSGLTSLPEVLRRVPGAEVMTMGIASHNLSFRGFNQRISNKVLVLVDGRPEYQDFLGVTLWAGMPVGLDEIERIEVIRGPGSALYGANAMLGVVNIITRAPGSGAQSEMTGRVGTGNTAAGSVVASGGTAVKYRASAGYEQADVYSRDYGDGRPDVTPTRSEPNLGVRSARANLTAYYAFKRDVSLAVSGGANRFTDEVYAIGLLRNFFLDGTSAYAKADLTAGPLKLRLFWNHLDTASGPQYEPLGQRSLLTHVDSNVFDGEALFQKDFELAGQHLFGAGVSGRIKRVGWSYMSGFVQEVHGAAFVQDEWRPLKLVTLVGSYRVDRHPLLDAGKPGYAQSPRLSVVVTPWEGHAFRGSATSAFRQPTYLESYTDLRVPVPGVNGASVLTQGSLTLRPEALTSFEVGYRGEAARLGLSWDVAAYWNVVKDLVVLSAVNPLPADQAWDAASQTFLLGRSVFTNDPTSYTARGVELGASWNATRGLDLRASAALQQVVANQAVAVCGPCTQAPAVKLNAGFTYKTPVKLDLSADASWVSGTTWVEREPSASDPTQIANLQNPLAAYAVVNARVGYRFFDDRASFSVVGTQLGNAHQEHPFGNLVSRRVMAVLTVNP